MKREFRFTVRIMHLLWLQIVTDHQKDLSVPFLSVFFLILSLQLLLPEERGECDDSSGLQSRCQLARI